jgi:hypothetical protein
MALPDGARRGHKRRWSIVPVDDVDAYARAAEAEFGGVVLWSVEPFTAGYRRPMDLHAGDEAATLYDGDCLERLPNPRLGDSTSSTVTTAAVRG